MKNVTLILTEAHLSPHPPDKEIIRRAVEAWLKKELRK